MPHPTPVPGVIVNDAPVVYGQAPTFPGIVTNVASLSTPTVGASPATVTNNTGVDCMAYINGGTVSLVKVSGTTLLQATNGSVYLPAGQSVVITYSAAPTVVLQAV